MDSPKQQTKTDLGNRIEPKARFMRDKRRADWLTELCGSDDFQAALEAALLLYYNSLYAESDQGAAIQHHKAIGAREFARILINIGVIVPEPPKKILSSDLKPT